MSKVKAEELIRIQDLLKEKFPNSAIGVVELKTQGIVRFEVRVNTEEEMKSVPVEFEGFPINTTIVTAKRLRQLKDIMNGKAHVRQP